MLTLVACKFCIAVFPSPCFPWVLCTVFPLCLQDVAEFHAQMHAPCAACRISVRPSVVMHLRTMWPLLTGGADAQQQLDSWEQKPESYTPPIQPWIKACAGRAIVVRTRSPATTPDLLTDLSSIQALQQLVVLPGCDDLEGSLTPQQLAILQTWAQQDSTGPWGILAQSAEEIGELTRVRRTFSAIIKHVELFLPNRLLLAANIKVHGGSCMGTWVHGDCCWGMGA